MNEVLLRVITAQISQGATDEAVRQISSGTVSGDWIVWTFPCMESKLKDVLWSQPEIQPNFEERFENLKQYALKDRKDAELYLSNPILRKNIEQVCSALLDYDIDYIWRAFDKWLTMIWSSLSVFEHLCPDCRLFHELRKKLFPDNIDYVSIIFFDLGVKGVDTYSKGSIIDEINPSSKKERKKVTRILKNFSISDSDGLRVTDTEFMPIYYDEHLYQWSELERAEDIVSIYHSCRSDNKIIKDRHGKLWLSTLYDDSAYDCRVVRTFIRIENVEEAETMCEEHGSFSSESSCRPPYFYRENMGFIKFVKPIPDNMTIRDEFYFTIENTQIL